MTPPAGSPAVIEGVIDGTWTTRALGDSDLAITEFDAELSISMPPAWSVDPAGPSSMPIALRLASFDVPAAMATECDVLNRGRFDAAAGWLTTTVGLYAALPAVSEARADRALIVLRTMGLSGMEHSRLAEPWVLESPDRC
ncbi:MAG: hypothetical protein ACYDB4_04260 [Candidatus Dormibacteraceae bacterium]